MIFRIDLTHRFLTPGFLVGVGDESGDTRDDEHRVSELVRKPQISGNGGNGAVDVDWQRMLVAVWTRVERPFDGTSHANVIAFELEFQGHLKQPCSPRVRRMKAVSVSGKGLTAVEAALDDFVGRRSERQARSHERQTAVEKAHTRFDVSTVAGTK